MMRVTCFIVRPARPPTRAARDARAAVPCVNWRVTSTPKTGATSVKNHGVDGSSTSVAIASSRKRAEKRYVGSMWWMKQMSTVKKKKQTSVTTPMKSSASLSRLSWQSSLPMSAKPVSVASRMP